MPFIMTFVHSQMLITIVHHSYLIPQGQRNGIVQFDFKKGSENVIYKITFGSSSASLLMSRRNASCRLAGIGRRNPAQSRKQTHYGGLLGSWRKARSTPLK